MFAAFGRKCNLGDKLHVFWSKLRNICTMPQKRKVAAVTRLYIIWRSRESIPKNLLNICPGQYFASLKYFVLEIQLPLNLQKMLMKLFRSVTYKPKSCSSVTLRRKQPSLQSIIRNATQWEFRAQAWASMPHLDDRNILLNCYISISIQKQWVRCNDI